MPRRTTAREPRSSFPFSLVVGGLAGLLPLAAGTALAKQGMVSMKDHHTFVGDVDEAADPGHVSIKTASGKVSVDSRFVDKVTYFNTPREELDARWVALDPKDLGGRIALAHFAIDNNLYDPAHEVLASALALDPKNREALDLQQKVDARIKAAQPAPPPTQPVAVAPPPVVRPGSLPAKRRLTADEVNLVRQLEWQINDVQVHVALAGDTRRSAIDLGIVSPSAPMNPAQIGWEILHRGPPGLRKGVRLGNNPAVLQTYNTQVQRFLVAGCATGQCHNTEKGGRFYLFTNPSDDTTALTDYVILQEFTRSAGGVEYSMIDRLHPTESLLIQYSLPLNLATVPHPKATGYTPPARANTVQIRQIQDWIATLAPVAPDYDIDLSSEPKKEEGKPGDAKPPAPSSPPLTRPAQVGAAPPPRPTTRPQP